MEDKKIIDFEGGEFKREIGLFGGMSIIGGIMIGSGIFYLGSIVLTRTNMSMGASLLCWLLGGIISLLGGLCFAELGTSSPEAGGMVIYLDKAYHPIVGYMFGFTSLVLSGSGSISALAIAIPTAFKSFLNLSDTVIKLIAVLIIIALTIYNCFGIKKGAQLQNISMIAKLIPIIAIIFAALIRGNQSPDLSIIPKDGNVNYAEYFSMIAFATIASLWAYDGWTNLNPVIEEMKDPEKNLPRALIFGIGGVTLIYVLFNFAIYKVLSFEKINLMIESGDLYLGTEVGLEVFGKFGAILVLITMLIAMFGSMNGIIIASPRYYYAMAKEGHFFKSFGMLHSKYNVPTVALIWQAIIAIMLVLIRSLDELTALVVFSGMLFNLLNILAVFIYRKKYPKLKKPYKVWGYPITVILTALIFAGLMINTFIDDPITAIIGLLVPLIGGIIYIIFDRKLKK